MFTAPGIVTIPCQIVKYIAVVLPTLPNTPKWCAVSTIYNAATRFFGVVSYHNLVNLIKSMCIKLYSPVHVLWTILYGFVTGYYM